MTNEILLVRHTEVALRWKGRCYGRSDVGLSRSGRLQAEELAVRLARERIASVICSGLNRTVLLAERIAALSGIEPTIDTRWQERDFGEWEGRTWRAIWRETGAAMDGMLSRPAHFRPGGGETTSELVRRTLAAWHALPCSGVVVVVTHAGPIAAVRARLAGMPLSALADCIPPAGSIARCASGALVSDRFTTSVGE